MGIVITVTSLLFLIGSVMWLKPSAKQGMRAKLRKNAIAAGFKPKLIFHEGFLEALPSHLKYGFQQQLNPRDIEEAKKQIVKYTWSERREVQNSGSHSYSDMDTQTETDPGFQAANSQKQSVQVFIKRETRSEAINTMVSQLTLASFINGAHFKDFEMTDSESQAEPAWFSPLSDSILQAASYLPGLLMFECIDRIESDHMSNGSGKDGGKDSVDCCKSELTRQISLFWLEEGDISQIDFESPVIQRLKRIIPALTLP